MATDKDILHSTANDGSTGEAGVPANPKTEAEKLAKDWQTGQAMVKDKNFTTQGDRENPKAFEEDLAEAGEEPETQGGEPVKPKA